MTARHSLIPEAIRASQELVGFALEIALVESSLFILFPQSLSCTHLLLTDSPPALIQTLCLAIFQ